MSTYGRTGRPQVEEQIPAQAPQAGGEQIVEGRDAQGGMRVDGFKQVLEMLEIADPAFRESLLKRIAQRDQRLALSLREALS
ncbi:MAG: hypothetical protein IT285_11745 [Bdellovibrionales bacterium]|nr:hypothetical protein [Bdellovibrionales bacterium]